MKTVFAFLVAAAFVPACSGSDGANDEHADSNGPSASDSGNHPASSDARPTDSNTDENDTGTGTATSPDTASGSETGDTDTGLSLHPFKGVGNSPADKLAQLNVSWCYNWMPRPQATDCDDPLFVPMIKGRNDLGAMAAVAQAGYDTILGFNEPNKTDQNNQISVADALELWPQLTAYPGIRVGSPAVSDDGRAWLDAFMAGVEEKGLRVDFIAMHWYGWNAGSCDDARQLEAALVWAEKFGRPVWITEFGCMHNSNPDAATVERFFVDALAMFERHPALERYAWYPWNTHSNLFDGNDITPLGQLFADAPAMRQAQSLTEN